jgi:hypothetical protein
MAYYAQIVNDIVTQVIVVNDDVPYKKKFCTDLFGGVWVETFMNIPNKNYASIGYSYDSTNKNFIAPQPYPSWTLDANDQWQPPVPQPPMPPETYWNEELQKWIPYEFQKN